MAFIQVQLLLLLLVTFASSLAAIDFLPAELQVEVMLYLSQFLILILVYPLQECASLQNLNVSILALGLLHDHRFILISSRSVVYELNGYNRSSLQEHSGLYLNGTSPILLSKKWPSMVSTASGFTRSVSIASNGDSFLALANKPLPDSLSSHLFSFTSKKTVSRQFHYLDGLTQDHLTGHWLSGSAENQFYVFNTSKRTFGTFRINLEQSSVRQVGGFLKVCKYSDTFAGAVEQIVFVMESQPCNNNEPVNWNLGPTNRTAGFTDGKWFVLLGTTLVYIFDVIAFRNPGTVVSVTVLNYTQFLICPQPDLEKVREIHKAIALVVVLLLFFLIVGMVFVHVYFLQRGAFQESPPLMVREDVKKLKTGETKRTLKQGSGGRDCKECVEAIKASRNMKRIT